MSEVGPFLVPNEDGRLSLIHDNKTIPLDHKTIELWWWHATEYMKRWAEEQRRNGRSG